MATSPRTSAIRILGRVRDLAENATMRLPRRRSASVVRVERGTVLVTQKGDLEDHVLERGDEIVLRGGGLAVAWAFTDAAISVRDAGESVGRSAGHEPAQPHC
jgi:Protein of unknown function (DUF2917)